MSVVTPLPASPLPLATTPDPFRQLIRADIPSLALRESICTQLPVRLSQPAIRPQSFCPREASLSRPSQGLPACPRVPHAFPRLPKCRMRHISMTAAFQIFSAHYRSHCHTLPLSISLGLGDPSSRNLNCFTHSEIRRSAKASQSHWPERSPSVMELADKFPLEADLPNAIPDAVCVSPRFP
jgi:hypothetical protein